MIDLFMSEFNQEMNQLHLLIQENQVSGSGAFLSKLKKKVNDSQSFLPAYNSKIVQSQLRDAEKDYNTMVQSSRPVKKFTFSQKLKTSSQMHVADVVDSWPTEVPEQKTIIGEEDHSSSNTRITDQKDQIITVNREDLVNQCFVMKDLTNCTITLKGPANTIHMERVTNCRIISAPTLTSVRIVACSHCEFSLSCHQLRIDSATDSVFHVLTRSGPIIENSSRLKFTTYDYEYPELEQDLQHCGLSRDQDLGRDVQDFNWLSPDQPSPNWSTA